MASPKASETRERLENASRALSGPGETFYKDHPGRPEGNIDLATTIVPQNSRGEA